MTSPTQSVPYGFCHCGCGQRTVIAGKSDSKWGYVRGVPIRFRRGHQSRQMRPASEMVEINGSRYQTIPLTQGKCAIVDIDDYERLSAYVWYATKSHKSGTYYAARTVCENGKNRTVSMHTEICPALPGFVVDHIDRNGLHNWRTNLRAVTHAQNLWNTNRAKTNTSGFTGAHWHGASGRWVSRIKINGREVYLGSYESKKEAAAAYSAGKCLRDELFRPSVRR